MSLFTEEEISSADPDIESGISDGQENWSLLSKKFNERCPHREYLDSPMKETEYYKPSGMKVKKGNMFFWEYAVVSEIVWNWMFSQLLDLIEENFSNGYTDLKRDPRSVRDLREYRKVQNWKETTTTWMMPEKYYHFQRMWERHKKFKES